MDEDRLRNNQWNADWRFGTEDEAVAHMRSKLRPILARLQEWWESWPRCPREPRCRIVCGCDPLAHRPPAIRLTRGEIEEFWRACWWEMTGYVGKREPYKAWREDPYRRHARPMYNGLPIVESEESDLT